MTLRFFFEALAAGAEQTAVWAHLLDRINVFPVADGDTGRNLVISLAPLRGHAAVDPEKLRQNLLLAARGNSGNIAAAFLQDFVRVSSLDEIAAAVVSGRAMAYGAVADPVPGTMLSLFDRLADLCGALPQEMNATCLPRMLLSLEQAVADTVRGQKVLQQAGVVDAGALGMYLFFAGFFSRLAGVEYFFSPAQVCFKDNLNISDSFSRETTPGFCIDAVVKSSCDFQSLSECGSDSAVVMRSGEYIKVHVHTADREKTKNDLAACGNIVAWADDDLSAQTAAFSHSSAPSAVHIMTDAAGSITREDAADLGLTLLDSYIINGESSLPETCCVPDYIYKAMRDGCRCSTAQASREEFRQRFAGVLSQNAHVVYLCVGSVYTGNYQVASEWKQKHDSDNRLSIIDTGTASGRLALAVHLTARFAARQGGHGTAPEVEEYAHSVLAGCHEYIFIDTLGYLASGGRLSKTSAFFGDMLKYKPVVSPLPGGAQKVGTVRNRDEQLRFAFEKLSDCFRPDAPGLILLQYTDNRGFVEDTAAIVQQQFPKTEILVRPLSLTTGVHTGPGTWAVAFAAETV